MDFDIKEKMAALLKLASAFGQKISKEQIETYLEALRSYSSQSVMLGVNKLIKTYEYQGFPRVATLIKAIEQEGRICDENLNLIVEYEWSKLREGIARVGRYRCPTFNDKITKEVVRMMGGWGAFCDFYTDEMPFRKKEFVELYVQLHKKNEEIALASSQTMAAINDIKKALPQTETEIVQ